MLFRSIPVLDPARQRQFVVSCAKSGAESERQSREAFWYREELLKGLSCSWTSVGQSWAAKRHGTVDLRGLRMVPRLIEALRIEDVEVTLRVDGQDVKGKATVEVDEFLTVVATIRNRSEKPIYPLLRLLPSLHNHDFSHTLDLSKKFVWSGTLQHSLPVLGAGQITEVRLMATPLSRGEYDIGACVEEMKMVDDGRDRMSRGQYGDGKRVGRERANTSQMMDQALGVRERRVWYVREALGIVVKGS